MELITSSGNYTVKETGASISYDYNYRVFADLDDAIEILGEAVCLKLIQRMEKVDANNTAREKAKTANGHSTRPVMSEAEKAEKKVARAEDKALLDAVKALSPEQREALGL